MRIFYFAFACLIYNTWVVLNAKAREKMTTIAIKLNYLLNIFIAYQMEIGMPGGMNDHIRNYSCENHMIEEMKATPS